MDSLLTPRYITPIGESCYKAISSSVSKDIFSYFTMLSMQCRKNISLQDKKELVYLAIASYINIYTYVIYDENDSKEKWLNKLNTAVCSYCWQKFSVVFLASGFPYLFLCPRQCKWKVATTYLAIRNKNDLNIRLRKSNPNKAPTN